MNELGKTYVQLLFLTNFMDVVIQIWLGANVLIFVSEYLLYFNNV